MRALQVIWVWMMTLCLFSLTSFVFFGIWAWNHPAFPAEKAKCIIERATFNRLMIAAKHPLLIEFPADLSRRFIIGWNMVVRGSAVDIESDTVLLYDNENSPTYRVAFTKNGCLVDSFDIPGAGFWQIIQSIDGQKRWQL